MLNIIQPITVQQAYDGITHARRWASPISWCSLSCVSNPIVGLLDGDGLDEIYHVIELVLLGFDP